MAVDRQAQCHCALDSSKNEPAQAPNWRFTSRGFESTSQHRLAQLLQPNQLAADDPARLCAYLLESYIAHGSITGIAADTKVEELLGWSNNLDIQLNTQQMYHEGSKLGLGSSAALMVALLGVVHRLMQRHSQTRELNASDAFQIAHSAHQASQGGVGSGLDIATSLTGGVIRFQAGAITPIAWPQELGHLFVYAGVPASTTELVGRFNRWHNNGTPKALNQLKLAAFELADGAINIDNLQRYISALKSLDREAKIGIFSPEHDWVSQLAERIGVLYNPCGAGGGDLGIALSDRPTRLAQFRQAMNDHHTKVATNNTSTNRLATIDLELAPHGLTVG